MTTSTVVFLSDAERTRPQRTFVTFGTPRGGTTMVAGILRLLGLWIGEDLPNNGEDQAFNLDTHRDDPEGFIARLPAEVAARDARHDRWGWKYPRAAIYLDDLLGRLRAPSLIVVLRDPLAGTLRTIPAEAPDQSDRAIKAMRLRQKWQGQNIALATAGRCPALLVSYEKAVLNPEAFQAELAHFCDLPAPDAALTARIRDFMRPGTYKDFPNRDDEGLAHHAR